MVAAGCGLVLVLILTLLGIGYIIRTIGTGLVNLATIAQTQLMIFLHWADKKFFPPGTAAVATGPHEPEINPP